MLLKEFLKDRVSNKPWSQAVYTFLAKVYSPTIVAYLFQGLKKKYDILNFSFNETSWSDFESRAYTTFLGNISVIWLGNCNEYDKAIQKKLSLFLKTYQGPHIIFSVWNEKNWEGDADAVIEYDKNFDFETVQLFFEYTLGKKIISEYKGITHYTAEQSVIFYLYTFLINDPQLLIKAGWNEKLFAQEASLFELSKLLFAKKKDAFFSLYNRLHDSYAPVFWTVFWSEQLWNAFLVVYFRRKKEFNTAKQVQGRLPFSFLQYDWQHYTLDELQHAHTLLTQIDRNLKLSASVDSLELFYYTFFQKNDKK